MPIEFRYSRCGKLLRTADGTAGRQAPCPQCGTIGAAMGVLSLPFGIRALVVLGDSSVKAAFRS